MIRNSSNKNNNKYNGSGNVASIPTNNISKDNLFLVAKRMPFN